MVSETTLESGGLEPTIAFDVSPAAGDVADERLRRARDLVARSGSLHYLAGYGVGMRYFDVDVLRALHTDEDAAAECRARCRKIGRKASFQVARHLNDWLTPLETGPLVRVVIRTAGGAVYCDQIVPGQFLVGASLPVPDRARRLFPGTSSPRAADEALSLFISEIRQEIRLQSQDLGGWESEQLRRKLLEADATSRREPPGALTGPAPAVSPLVCGRTEHPALDLCRSAIGLETLQAVGLFDDGRHVFSADVLHHRDVTAAPMSTLGPAARRRLYRRIGEEMPAYVRELARTARDVIGGPMTSAVLDVEYGALYFRRLDPASYLIGVTLRQSGVTAADDALAVLARQWPR